MGKLILVTGGARSGKSTFAEDMAKKLGEDILYIATSIPFDDEMQARIKKHREQRPSHWETLEAYKGFESCLPGKLESKSGAMLDCVTVMITNLMLELCDDIGKISSDQAAEIEDAIRSEVDKLVNIVKSSPVSSVLVTNEVGMGIVPEYVSARVFRDIAGRVNQLLAKEADEVYFCVSGIPMRIK